MTCLLYTSVPETCRTWVVTPHLRAQESVASQLETWGVHNILFVPEKEVALGEEVGDPELTAERLNVLHRIASGQIGRLTVVLTENSLNDEVPSTRGMKNQGMILKAGETRPPDELEKLFTEAGFEGVPQVISLSLIHICHAAGGGTTSAGTSCLRPQKPPRKAASTWGGRSAGWKGRPLWKAWPREP